MNLEQIEERLQLFPDFLTYILDRRIEYYRLNNQFWDDFRTIGIMWIRPRHRTTFVARTFDDWLMMIGRYDLYLHHPVPKIKWEKPKERPKDVDTDNPYLNEEILWRDSDNKQAYDGSKLNRFFSPIWPAKGGYLDGYGFTA